MLMVSYEIRKKHLPPFCFQARRLAASAVHLRDVGATTDYIWRGDTQTGGDASLSGGLDADFGNGFAIGTWVGSLGASDDDSYELDIYATFNRSERLPSYGRLYLISISGRR